MNPLFLIDFYKVGHVSQYPADTEQVWSNWTPRSSRTGQNKVVFFGLQYFCKEYLARWEYDFFDRPLKRILNEYRDVIRQTLGVQEPKTDHIEKLWELQYLPLDIYAIPEGDSTPLRIPQLVITNTQPEAFWLPNYFETVLSNILWKACTSATTAQAYRKLFIAYAKAAQHEDLSFVDWMGHDFSYRGMAGTEDAILSGMGHLLSFSGTDTIPAIIAADKYYHSGLNVGGSVPATEHSVMQAGGKDDEFETFKRLITEVYPKGIVSIVSDTWDLWRVLTDYIPRLQDTILAREGKLVIRPDSGDPVKIICGDENNTYMGSPIGKGTLRLLAQALGVGAGEYPLINKAGAIYGDSITLERAKNILHRIVHELKLSPYNMVFGIGSYTYEYVTRDTYGFAVKATAVRRNGKILNIFKKPVTDDGTKNSLLGIPIVTKGEDGNYCVKDEGTPEQLASCDFRKVYSNGDLLIDEDFTTIRKRVRA